MITIYGATWCAFCKTEKQWLDSLSVEYVYKDVDTDEEAMSELRALNVGESVPVTIIEKDGKETIIRGFQRLSIKNAAGI